MVMTLMELDILIKLEKVDLSSASDTLIRGENKQQSTPEFFPVFENAQIGVNWLLAIVEIFFVLNYRDK